jgi:prevent-host-death family protein
MKTIEVGTFEAKNTLSQLLVKAARGQRILITRRGCGVAVLSAPDAVAECAEAHSREDLITRLRAFRKKARAGRETLKSMIEEGRR